MTGEELKEQLVNQLTEFWSKIEETSAYNQLRDRYETLSAPQQRLAIAGTALLLAGILIYIPFTMLETSWSYEEDFVSQRDLIREMYKVQREIGETPQIPIPNSPEMIRQSIDSYIKSSGFLPEQIRGLNVTNPSSRLIPNKHVSGGLDLSMAKLTIRQVVDIAYKVMSSSPSTKVYELTVTNNSEDPKYQDLTIKLLALNVPDIKSLSALPDTEEDSKNTGNKNRRNSGSGRGSSNQEEDE